MTHEYVIALGGSIQGATPGGPAPTAIAWASDRVLAVGRDDVVEAISRGDSLFLDLEGRTVRALDVDGAATLDAGVPADLAFEADGRVVATLRAGRFTEGDARSGPFRRRDR